MLGFVRLNHKKSCSGLPSRINLKQNYLNEIIQFVSKTLAFGKSLISVQFFYYLKLKMPFSVSNGRFSTFSPCAINIFSDYVLVNGTE